MPATALVPASPVVRRVTPLVPLSHLLVAHQAGKQFQGLYSMFIASDATQVEINPLAIGGVPGGPGGRVICVDAKLNFDDNASYRQKDLFAQRDLTMEDPRDVAAESAGLNYIGLDGNIGCLGASCFRMRAVSSSVAKRCFAGG